VIHQHSSNLTESQRADSLFIEQNHLLEQIACGRPLSEVLTELCLVVPKLNPGTRACVVLADELRQRFARFITPDLAPAFGVALEHVPINDLCLGTCGEAIYSGKPALCADVTQDERWSKMWRELCLSCGILAGYSQPVLDADGAPVAAFFLCFGEPRTPDAWELKLAAFGAHVASIAIARDRTIEVRQRDIDDAQRLQEISAQLIEQDNVQALYECILDAAVSMMRSDFASLQQFHPERGQHGELHLLGCRGYDPAAAKFWEWVRADSGCSCGEVMRTGQRVIIPDVRTCAFMAGSTDQANALRLGMLAMHSTPLISRSGNLVGMISTHWKQPHQPSDRDLRMFDVLARQAADLIEHNLAVGALRESEERYRGTFANAAIGIGRVAFHNATWIEVNEALCRLVGYSREEMQRTPWPDITHPDDVDLDLMPFRRMAEGELDTYTVEKRFIHKHGHHVWARLTLSLVRDADGRPLYQICIAEDIGKRKSAEQALLDAQAHLRKWNVELEQVVAVKTTELVQSQARLRAMATELNLAEQRERKRLATHLHDHLQQILVLGKLIVGQGKRAAAAVPATVEVMNRIDDIFSEALTYTRTLVADLSPPALREHGLAAGLKWLGEYMKKYQITVTVTVPEQDDLTLLEDQAVLLFQSVRELLINASKHAGTQQADVRLERDAEQLRIQVSDKGAGFDPATATAGEVPNESLSSKFGLFSIQERMRALGGSFELQSAPGKGTTAMLMLPMRRNVDQEGLRAVSSKTAGKTRPKHTVLNANRLIRVLLVDDHPMMRQGLRSIVTAYDHFDVVGEAADGTEAVELAQRLNPDVVVMDINLPKMNGIEATRQIRAKQSATVVIGLSVNQSVDTEHKMKAAGAFTYLTKESASDELCQAIEQAVSFHAQTVPRPV
jgi:PAS domain S-box-containing protein